MNKLKVGIMHKGYYATIEINPDDKKEIDRAIKEYLEEDAKQILVDLQVTYEERKNCYTHKNFSVKDFDKAVEFLQSKDEEIIDEG